MSVSQKVIKAAISGPEAKKVKIKELKSSKKHEFNVKPLSMSINEDGELDVYGQISHHISFKPDNQYWFGFVIKGNNVKPKKPEEMILRKEKGSFKNTISSVLKKKLPSKVVNLIPMEAIEESIKGKLMGSGYGAAVVAAAETGITISESLSKGHDSAVLNYLDVLSKAIKPPKKLTRPGITLYKNNMFGGNELHIKKSENIEHLKNKGWNDKASSLIATVPKGMKLEVFKHDAFRGDSITFDSGTHYIRDLKIHKLGDELTSVKWSKV